METKAFKLSRNLLSMRSIILKILRTTRVGVYIGLLDTVLAIIPTKQRLKYETVHVKLDNIGDFVIWLRSVPGDSLGPDDLLVTSESNRALVDLLGIAVEVEFIDTDLVIHSIWYRLGVQRRMRGIHARVAINYQYSRSIILGDSIIRWIVSGTKRGLEGDEANQSPLQYLVSNRWYSDLYAAGDEDVHESQILESFLVMLGKTGNSSSLMRPIFGWLQTQSVDVNRPYIVVAIDASSETKTFPRFEYLIQLIDSRMSELGSNCQLVVVGSSTSPLWLRRLAASSSRVNDFVGKTSFSELLVFVSAASFFVSNDSLVGHIAALFSIPGVVISSNLLPGRFFPYPLHPSIRVALSPDSCECASRCIRGGRRAARPCLTRVSPELVVSELRNLGVKV